MFETPVDGKRLLIRRWRVESSLPGCDWDDALGTRAALATEDEPAPLCMREQEDKIAVAPYIGCGKIYGMSWISRHFLPNICGSIFALLCLTGCERSRQLCQNTDGIWTTGRQFYDARLDVLHMYSSGEITYNKRAVDEEELREILFRMGQMFPAVILRHDKEVPCWEVLQMRSLMRRSLDCEHGKCLEGPAWDRVPEAGVSGW